MRSLFCLWVLTALAACEFGPDLESHQFAGSTMGTSYHITVVTEPDQTVPPDLSQSIDAWLAAINESMSTYLADSELSRLNEGPVNEWVSVTPMLAEVLAEAQSISRLSDGAFDVTIGPLVDLWGFGPVDTDDQVPSNAALAEVKQRVGYGFLDLDPESPAVRRRRNLRIDLSAIAKGYGADYVGRQLAALGLDNFMVEIGGDLLVSGHNQKAEPWKIGVEKPGFAREGVQQVVAVTDEGLATSGDYRNFFRQDGQIYSHILDPRLGRPVKRDVASVTVIADSAARADGLATALTVMGLDEGLALVEDRQIAAYFIVRQDDGFTTRESAAFARYTQDL